MKHNVDGRKFGRNTSHRVAMFRNMANSVIQSEQIVTTVQKAKEARRVVDRLVTLAKRGGPASRRLAFDRTRDEAVVKKLFDELVKRYEKRPGGYTRVLRLSDRRWGDAAEMALLELVDHPEIDRRRKPKKAGAEGSKDAAADGKGQAQADPFSKFRKMFSRKPEKGSGGPSKARASASKTGGAGRKAPAAGGSNKSGGSS